MFASVADSAATGEPPITAEAEAERPTRARRATKRGGADAAEPSNDENEAVDSDTAEASGEDEEQELAAPPAAASAPARARAQAAGRRGHGGCNRRRRVRRGTCGEAPAAARRVGRQRGTVNRRGGGCRGRRGRSRRARRATQARTRRGTRGGRNRKRKTPTAATAEGDEPAADAPVSDTADSAGRPKCARACRARRARARDRAHARRPARGDSHARTRARTLKPTGGSRHSRRAAAHAADLVVAATAPARWSPPKTAKRSRARIWQRSTRSLSRTSRMSRPKPLRRTPRPPIRAMTGPTHR